MLRPLLPGVRGDKKLQKERFTGRSAGSPALCLPAPPAVGTGVGRQGRGASLVALSNLRKEDTKMARGMCKVLATLFCVGLIIIGLCAEVLGQTKTLIVGIGTEAPDLLPSSQNQGTMDRTYSIYEPLVWLDEDAKPVPRLATKWEAMDGNKRWRFHLRRDVLFHNGEKFTAEDVGFTIDFSKKPENKLGRRGKVVGYTYKIVDDYTIDIFREDGKPVDPVLPSAWLPIHMLSKPTVTKMAVGEFPRKPIGTGPFQFVEWKEGEQITLKAFDKYWGGKPKIDRVIFKAIPELATRLVALKTGEVDVIRDIPAEEIKSLQADPNIRVVEKPSLYSMHLVIRSDMPPFKDNIDLRKAVAHAINAEAICKDILGGFAIAEGQVNPPAAFGYNKNLKPYKYDPELAKEYLKKAGYKGEEISIQSSTGRYLKDIEITTAVEMFLKEVGFRTRLNMYDWPTWMDKYNTKKIDLLLYEGWAARSGDAAENLYNVFHSKSPFCYYGEKGIPGVDELIDTAATNFDPEVRRQALGKAQEIVHDYYACGFYSTPLKVYGVRKNVKWSPRADETTCFSHTDEKL